MIHFVTLLITLRVMFCPLFCGLQQWSGPTDVTQTVERSEKHACCHHCASEADPAPQNPASQDHGPSHSCPDCACFCNPTAITDVRVELEDLSSSVLAMWAYHSGDRLGLQDPLPVDRESMTRVPGSAAGRSLRVVLASLLI